MSESQGGTDSLSEIRRLGITILVIDAVAFALDYLLITYVDLSFLWSWMPGLSVAGKLSTLLFVEGGILAAVGTLVGGGMAESEVDASLPSGGLTAGPELQGRVTRERTQMRDEQVGFGLRALAIGFSLVLLSVVVAVF